MEFQLLGKLLASKNRILSREQLVMSFWGEDQLIEPRTIDSHIRIPIARADDRGLRRSPV
nr:helix-turn-helix domain-containing protein [Exiguobacterium sp. KRL4]